MDTKFQINWTLLFKSKSYRRDVVKIAHSHLKLGWSKFKPWAKLQWGAIQVGYAAYQQALNRVDMHPDVALLKRLRTCFQTQSRASLAALVVKLQKFDVEYRRNPGLAGVEISPLDSSFLKS